MKVSDISSKHVWAALFFLNCLFAMKKFENKPSKVEFSLKFSFFREKAKDKLLRNNEGRKLKKNVA